MQAVDRSADLLYPATFLILMVSVVGVLSALYVVGRLPGRIARERGHPHATAIALCGWLGALVFIIWPFALIWAYVMPRQKVQQRRRELSDQDITALALCSEEVDALLEELRAASRHVAGLRKRIAARKPNGEQVRTEDRSIP